MLLDNPESSILQSKASCWSNIISKRVWVTLLNYFPREWSKFWPIWNKSKIRWNRDSDAVHFLGGFGPLKLLFECPLALFCFKLFRTIFPRSSAKAKLRCGIIKNSEIIFSLYLSLEKYSLPFSKVINYCLVKRNKGCDFMGIFSQ